MLPFDILVLFAQAGGHTLAVALASTCQAMKKRIDQRYVVTKYVKFSGEKRRPGVVGRFVSLIIHNNKEQHIPESTLNIRFEGGDCSHIPPSVRTIEFGRHWNNPIHNVKWPEQLVSLKFGFAFDQLLPVLPFELEVLEFGEFFSQPVFQLPFYLKRLVLGRNFNHTLPVLPETLEELFLPPGFSHQIRIPHSLKTLHMGRVLQRDMGTLVEVCLPDQFNETLDNVVFPDTLRVLVFGWYFNRPVVKLRLPSGLTKLVWGYTFNQPLCPLPESLEELYFGTDFNQPINRFPFHLKILSFGHDFDQPIQELPIELTELIFGDDFDQSIGHLPETLTKLSFGSRFNRPVIFPPKLIELNLGHHFAQPLDLTHLCDLQRLSLLCSGFLKVIPRSLKFVTLLPFRKDFQSSVSNLLANHFVKVRYSWNEFIRI